LRRNAVTPIPDADARRTRTPHALMTTAGVVRQIAADPVDGFTAMVTGAGGAVATAEDRDPAVPPWTA